MKYLEFSDFHFEPGPLHDTLAEAIQKAAIDNEVDFIAHAGDLFNRPIMTSEKGGINQIRRIIKSWASVCPVAAIYGTPSHEAPGSLDPLEDCGLTVLRPGYMYGGYWGNVGLEIKPIFKPDAGYMNPDIVLFGIPELSKKTIQAQLNLPADQANAQAEELLRRYILEFIAPMRLRHKDVPAICLFHGNLSDTKRENCTDIVLTASDIVMHSEDFLPANLTRLSLGHIHKPWESKKINAGYPGSYGQTWGETDFIPGFNIVDTESGEIIREPYGTPKRVVITKPLAEYDKTVAYWLKSDDPDALCPAGHAWSRVTYENVTEATSRVTEATDNMSLSDLAKIADPEITDSMLLKFGEIVAEIKPPIKNTIDLAVDSVEIQGCSLFKGRTVALNISDLENGLTELHGGNGSGKSSLMAFCSPYPVIIGKDTKSGRDSAIKDFFPETGSIKKTLTVNGEKHNHFITVGKTKTECYLDIDGAPQLDKGTFAEMMDKCVDLYGPFEDYFLTTFYAQPLQGKTGSSLMSASMVDIRNLVQSIAGINREQEKRYALDRVSEIEAQVKKDQAFVDAAEEFKIDIQAEKSKLENLKSKIRLLNNEISALDVNIKNISFELDGLKKTQAINDSEIKRKNANDSRIIELRGLYKVKQDKIKELNALVENLESNKNMLEKIKANEKLKSELADYRNRKNAYELENRNKKSEYDNKKQKYESTLAQIEMLSDPCPSCGFIRDNVKQKINALKSELIDPGTPPEIIPFSETEPVPIEISGNPDIIQQEIDKANSASQVIAELKNTLDTYAEEGKRLAEETYNINNDIDSHVNKKQEELNDIRSELDDKNRLSASMQAQTEQINQNIIKAEKDAEKLDDIKCRIEKKSIDSGEWSAVAALLNPNKIPAIEMEIMLSSIDTLATDVLSEFLDGRFSFRTETQQEGKQGTVDRFDIKIHDNETGIYKSFLEHSPGEKAFFSDAYVKALIRKRNDRMLRSYSPIISDEADGPIEPGRIPEYYDIQRRYFKSEKVLVISHNPASHEHIKNQINIKELMK